MKKGFGNLFSESFKEFKDNFKYFFLIIFLFMFIPGLINYFVAIPLKIEFMKLGQNPATDLVIKTISANMGIFLLSLLVGLVCFLISIFAYVSITCGVLGDKKKFNFKESLNNGKKNYFRYLGFSIVLGVFLLLLSILLVIPAIIFGVFWCFSCFIFIKEKKGIIDSLKASKKLVDGKWWITFGYLLLALLIIFFISFGVSFVSGIINIIINPDFLLAATSNNSTLYYSSPVWYVNDVVSLIFSFIGNLITIPVLMLFLRNFYFARRG